MKKVSSFKIKLLVEVVIFFFKLIPNVYTAAQERKERMSEANDEQAIFWMSSSKCQQAFVHHRS